MQISSVGSSSSNYLLEGKIYSAGTVLNRLIEKTNNSDELTDEKESIGIQEKVTGDMAEASSDELLQVNDIDSLQAADDHLHSMLGLAKFATGDLTAADRERLQKEFAFYSGSIDSIGEGEQEALEADESTESTLSLETAAKTDNLETYADALNVDFASVSDTVTDQTGTVSEADEQEGSVSGTDDALEADSDDTSESWTSKLGISDVSVDADEDAEDIANAIEEIKEAIVKVEMEIKDLSKTTPAISTTVNSEISHAANTSDNAITDSSSALEYFGLLKSCMLSDSTQTMVAQTSNYPSYAQETSLDMVC